jgi:hypothetical protein
MMAAWTPRPPYTIWINGRFDATVLSDFPALVQQHRGAYTVLTGLLDHSALYGVLAVVEALGLDLIEVRRHLIQPCLSSPGPQ